MPGEKRCIPTVKRGSTQIWRQIQRSWSPSRNIGRSLRNVPRWNLSEDWGSGTGGLHIAARQRGEPQEQIRGIFGYRRKLAAACKKVSRRASVTRLVWNIWRKILTQGNFGPRNVLAAAGISVIHSAEVPWCREHGLQGEEKDDITPRTPKGRTSRMKRWKGTECKIGKRAHIQGGSCVLTLSGPAL
jgi:hypothetical protein